jgi:hypothetical protein
MTLEIVTEYTNTRTIGSLIDAIRSHGKNIVVADARWNTYYPVDGRFRPANLVMALAREGIEYSYYHDLGNPFHKISDVVEMERQYKERVVTTREFTSVVNRVMNERGIICLLCYCAPPSPCHRFWLRDMILHEITGKTAT